LAAPLLLTLGKNKLVFFAELNRNILASPLLTSGTGFG
jgi:hypothetical protein